MKCRVNHPLILSRQACWNPIAREPHQQVVSFVTRKLPWDSGIENGSPACWLVGALEPHGCVKSSVKVARQPLTFTAMQSFELATNMMFRNGERGGGEFKSFARD
mmetsp:Transcript_1089/g.2997  ORF Transcript_1089/g.2997 Transcript_1089/m.2997 type:complete len:105 (+) Transcript_1089:18-332(+)